MSHKSHSTTAQSLRSLNQQLSNPNLRSLQQVARSTLQKINSNRSSPKRSSIIRRQSSVDQIDSRNVQALRLPLDKLKEIQEIEKQIELEKEQEETQLNKEEEDSELVTDSKQEECVLDDPDIPPVSEVEHLVGHCFCHLCTCGLHLCPLQFRRSNLPSGKFMYTKYKEDFRKPEPTPQLPKKEDIIPSGSLCNYMDLRSTQREHYVAHSPLPPMRQEQKLRAPMQFTARSSYEADFPNWQFYENIRVKRPVFPTRSPETIIPIKSSYSDTYTQKRAEPVKEVKHSNESQFKSGPFAQYYGEVPQSTTSREFKTPTKLLFAIHRRSSSTSNLTTNEYSGSPCKSTYQQEFSSQHSKKVFTRKQPKFN